VVVVQARLVKMLGQSQIEAVLVVLEQHLHIQVHL
jgi:hypothetical protein